MVKVVDLTETKLADLWREVKDQDADDFWGDLKEETLRIAKALIEGHLESEMIERVGAGLYQRHPDRSGWRNGHYSRSLLTEMGLITDLPLEGDMMMMMRGMPTQPWFIMDTLRSMFEVRTLGGDFDRVPDDIDVLMLAHPKSVSDKTQYAIDQFVLKGGRALVFVDPYAESEAGRSRMMGGGPGGSDLPKLFQAWGVEMVKDKVAGDRANARRVNAGTPGRVVPADYVAWLTMRQGNINRDDPLMSNIGQVNMASAGILKKREGATTTLEPLITTSPQSMAVDVAKLSGGPGGQPDVIGILREFKPGLEGLIVAARITGEAATAFPDGPPKPKDGDGAAGRRSEERRVGKECRSRWSPYH